MYLLLPPWYPCVYSDVGGNLVVVPVLGGEFSAHFYNTFWFTYLKVTRCLQQSGRLFWCNVSWTQPIEILLVSPSCKSTQLCGFTSPTLSHKFTQLWGYDILPPLYSSTQCCGMGIFNSLCYGPFSYYPPFQFDGFINHMIFWMGGLVAPDVQYSIFPPTLYSWLYCPPTPTIIFLILYS